MAYGYIYETTNLIDGTKYIGKRVGFNDVNTYMGSGIYLRAAQNKYGIENFSKRILNEYDTKEELCEAEKYFISIYRYFYGHDGMYNIADGGEGFSCKHTEATKKKISDTNKGKHHTESAKKKMSDAKKGEKNTRSRKINQYNLEGNFISTWNCITDAQRELNIPKSNISDCCKGKRNKAGGFIWHYAY